MLRLAAFTLLIGLTSTVWGQDKNYARAVVDSLTSPWFSGRGYVNMGDQRAAEYIAGELKRHGAKPFQKDYYQLFSFPVNTFPGNMTVKADDQTLVPGKHYIVDPSSNTLQGQFGVVWYNKANVPRKGQFNRLVKRRFFDQKLIILDEQDAGKKAKKFNYIKHNVFGAEGIVLVQDQKLTWHISQRYSHYPTIRVLRDHLPRETKSLFIDIQNEYLREYTSQNVVGYIEGTEYPDSFVVFTGHYDHLGTMGRNTYFPGANDNASGIAMILNFAQYYAKHPPKYSVAFMAFSAEEVGLLGSKYYTKFPLFPLSKIKFLINLDIMGTGDEGITVVNATEHVKAFDTMVQLNEEKGYLALVKRRGKTSNSDHYWFSQQGVPAFFIYTMGGIKAYHDVYDRGETLPLTEFEDVFRLLTDFVNTL